MHEDPFMTRTGAAILAKLWLLAWPPREMRVSTKHRPIPATSAKCTADEFAHERAGSQEEVH